MIKALYEYKSALTHLLYPHHCAGCGSDLLEKKDFLCHRCTDEMPVTNFHFHANNPVEKIFWGRIPVYAATSLYYFTKSSTLQNLLHLLKYKGRKDIGTFLGRTLGEELSKSNRFNFTDAIVALPLSSRRERARGYNQASVIAEAVADVLKLPVVYDAIERTSFTESQTKKSRQERWNNIEGKFRLSNGASLADKNVLLLDDVLTTGATLEACGKTICSIPGTQLSIATVAYTSS